jgi:hypothetical protein
MSVGSRPSQCASYQSLQMKRINGNAHVLILAMLWSREDPLRRKSSAK